MMRRVFEAIECTAEDIGEALDCMGHPFIGVTDLGAMQASSRERIRKARNPKSALYQARQAQLVMEKERDRHRISALLSRLKKEGLVKQEPKSGVLRWVLTAAGKNKYDALQARASLPYVRDYTTSPSPHTTLVIFDVPEKYRYKRDWLRGTLDRLGFEQVQKSVWRGNVQMPKEFIFDLDKYSLSTHVHIFSVVKQGTLKR